MSLSKSVRRTLRSLGAMPQHMYNSPSKFGRSNNNILHIKPRDINCSKITDASLRRTNMTQKQKMYIKHLCSHKRVANRDSRHRSARNRSHSRSLLEKGKKMNNNNRAIQQILENTEFKMLNNEIVRAQQSQRVKSLQKRVNKL